MLPRRFATHRIRRPGTVATLVGLACSVSHCTPVTTRTPRVASSIEARGTYDARSEPRELAMHWLGVSFGLRDWNESLATFATRNPSLRVFSHLDGSWSCVRGTCTQSFTPHCAGDPTFDPAPSVEASIVFRLVARQDVVVGADLLVDSDAAALWHVCDRRGAGTYRNSPRTVLGSFRDAITAMFPTARETPRVLSAAVLEDDAYGAAQWSFVVRCDEGGCLRVDGVHEAGYHGRIGVRIRSLPTALLAARGYTPIELAESGIAAPSDVTVFAPAEIHGDDHTPSDEFERAEWQPPRRRAAVRVVSPTPGVDVSLVPDGLRPEDAAMSTTTCITPCAVRVDPGRYRLTVASESNRLVRGVQIDRDRVFRVTPPRSRVLGVTLALTGAGVVIGGVIGFVSLASARHESTPSEVMIPGLVGLGFLTGGGIALVGLGAGLSNNARGGVVTE